MPDLPRARKRAGRPAKRLRAPYDLQGVVDAAVRVFNRHGYEAGSMADIARETGLSKASLYHHVSSKEELLGGALRRAFTPLFAALQEVEARVGSPRERLRDVVRRATLITLEFAPEVELLQRIKGNTAIEREWLRRRHQADRAVQAIVEAAIAAGELRSDLDAGVVTKLIFGMSNSITQWYRPGGKISAGAIARAVVALLFEGMQSAAP